MIKKLSNDDFLHSCIYRKVYLHEKSTKASPKILLLAKFWVRKSIFSSAVSKKKNKQTKKTKTENVFFLSALTLNWRHSWKSTSAISFSAAYKATCTIPNAHFGVKVEGVNSFGIILNVPASVNFSKLRAGKRVLFEQLGLNEMFSLDED